MTPPDLISVSCSLFNPRGQCHISLLQVIRFQKTCRGFQCACRGFQCASQKKINCRLYECELHEYELCDFENIHHWQQFTYKTDLSYSQNSQLNPTDVTVNDRRIIPNASWHGHICCFFSFRTHHNVTPSFFS